MMSKIQNLNGTHNFFIEFDELLIVVYDVKDTKFEWNSQRLDNNKNKPPKLFMITKIQKLSAIHNRVMIALTPSIVVYDYKDTKIVSNL